MYKYTLNPSESNHRDDPLVIKNGYIVKNSFGRNSIIYNYNDNQTIYM